MPSLLKSLAARLPTRLRLALWRMTQVDEIDVIRPVLLSDTSPGQVPVMVDVGANHGASLLPFAQAGWTVYAFEPDPGNRKTLEDICKPYPGVSIDGRALSDRAEKAAPFYRSDRSAGISSLTSFDSSHREDGTVEVTTLGHFVSENGLSSIRFLKVDTEGLDLLVLRGAPWDQLQPDVVLCEFENAKTEPLGYRFEDMADFLASHGYRVLISEWYPIRAYGGPHRWRRFQEYPSSLADDSGWGNLIAARDSETFGKILEHARSLEGRWKAVGVVSKMRQTINV